MAKITNITFNKYYDEYILECIGHSGYASYGNDILCSAVSILCLSLEAYLTDAYQCGKITSFSSDISNGYAYIKFKCDEFSPILEGIKSLLCGFTLLYEAFPDYISYEE